MTPTDKQYALACIELVHVLADLPRPTLSEVESLLGTTFEAEWSQGSLLAAPTELFAEIVLRRTASGSEVLTLTPPESRLVDPALFLQRSAFGSETRSVRDLHAPNGGSAHTFFEVAHVRLCVETGYIEQYFRRFSLEWLPRSSPVL
jgi:hypothetical protein